MMSSDGLSRTSPDRVGVSSRDIDVFLEAAADSGIELHSVMLFRSGSIIAEGCWWPYRPDLPHMMHSATKSFLSVAVGLAVSEGYFSLEDRVCSFFQDRVPKDASKNLLDMTVEDLLTQTSGHDQGRSGGEWRSIERSLIDEFFSIPVPHQPGSKFAYSSATSFMLSAIITKTTGQCARDFLEPRLFRPLGIKMLSWDLGAEQINPGGNGITCLTSDYLKLAILHLQQGQWNGKQILPKEWVLKATSSQRNNPYGYHFWVNPDGSYRASGMFGQLAMVFPMYNAILVTTGAVPRGAVALMNLVNQHVPVMFQRPDAPISDDDESRKSLLSRLQGLRLLPPFKPSLNNSSARRVSKERWVTRPNDDSVVSFGLDFQDNTQCILHVQDGRGFHRATVGLADWAESTTSFFGAKLHHGYELAETKVVAGGRWKAADVFEMTLQFVETAFRNTVRVTFLDDFTISKLDRSVNINSFGTRRPTVWACVLITGKEMEVLDARAAEAQVEFSLAANTVGELLDNPVTRAILEEQIPDVINNPRIEGGRRYSFNTIMRYAEGLTPEILEKIDSRLAKLNT